MQFRRALPVALLVSNLALTARADLTVYYHVGAWDAFDGPGDNGQPVCGIGSRNPSDGHAFSLRFPIGGDEVSFIAAKPGWNIPDGTQLPVVMQIGLEQPWSGQAVGSGQRVQWTLHAADMQIFDAQFRRATSMTVTFPSGNEQSWVIPLAGSTAASNAMGRCVTDLTQRAATAQSAATPAPAAQSSTQPFGAVPPGTGNASPAAQQNPAAAGNPAPPAQGGPAPSAQGNQAAPAQGNPAPTGAAPVAAGTAPAAPANAAPNPPANPQPNATH